MKQRYYITALILSVLTVGYLFANVAYIDGFAGGIKGVTAIFGGREVLESMIGLKGTFEFGVTINGIIMFILIAFSVFLLLRSASEKSNSLMGFCGVVLIVCAILNLICVSNINVLNFDVDIINVNNVVAYGYSLACLILSFVCFAFSGPSSRK